MRYLPDITDPEMADTPSARRYYLLIEYSRVARMRGNHWAAQQYATAAHKWAMDEHTRLQRLAHAREQLASATRQLETAWDRDRECTTIDELRERHPEFKRVITLWETAKGRVEDLKQLPPEEECMPDPKNGAW